ncbi:MAG TPA: hypothetical protein VGJ47_04975, partial [Gemmatimonadaceae bacterium]
FRCLYRRSGAPLHSPADSRNDTTSVAAAIRLTVFIERRRVGVFDYVACQAPPGSAGEIIGR